jgi:hypothetical protein
LTGQLCGFGDRQALQSRVFDGGALFRRQVGQHLCQIALGVARFGVAVHRQGLGPIVDVVVQFFTAAMGTQVVHPLVACNRNHPGGERLITLVGVALLMDGHQGFLHKVLNVAGLGLQALSEKAAHISTEQRQHTLVAGAVALQ